MEEKRRTPFLLMVEKRGGLKIEVGDRFKVGNFGNNN